MYPWIPREGSSLACLAPLPNLAKPVTTYEERRPELRACTQYEAANDLESQIDELTQGTHRSTQAQINS